MKTTPLDIAEHLNSIEEIRAFLKEAADTGSGSDYVHALNTAARAYGMTKVAKKAGVTRASLYKSLAPGGDPKFSTINKLTKAFGLKLGAS